MILRPGLRFGFKVTSAGGPRRIGLKQTPDLHLPLHWPGAPLPSVPSERVPEPPQRRSREGAHLW